MFTLQEVYDMVVADGVAAVFKAYASTTYSTTTGKVTRGSLVSHSVTVSPPMADGNVVKQFGNIDGVKEAKLFSIVPALGLTFEPAVGQEFVWDSQTWTVTWTNPLRDAGGVLAYQFGIKGVA